MVITSLENIQTSFKSLKEKHRHQLPLSEFAYLILKDAILQGILPENQNLNERFLAEILELSRTPIHDALIRLEGEGLVQGAPNGGVQIPPLTLQDMMDIYEIRFVLEGLAARLAAERAPEPELDRFNYILEQSELAAERGEVDRLTFLATLFHETIAQSTRNRYLSELVSRFHSSIQRVKCVTLAYSPRTRHALAEHRQLAEAIRARNPQEAERIAQQHMINAKQTYIRLYQEKQLRENLPDSKSP